MTRTPRDASLNVMPGLVPGIHVFRLRNEFEDVDAPGRRPGHDAWKESGTPRAMLTETSDYAKLYRDFRWDIPARFNIATACCDRHADGSGRLALIYVDEDGAAQRTSFDEMRAMSRRFANVLKADGLIARRPRRGVSVAVAGTADRPSRGVSLRPGVGAAVHAVRRGRAGIPPAEFRRQGGRHRRGAAGRSWRKSATGCRTCRISTSSATALRRRQDRSGRRSRPRPTNFATVDTSADDPAIIIYTSGTTGNPKGALHAHRVLLGHLPNVEMVHDFLPKPGDVMWTPADWAWIGGLFDALFPAWYHGVPVVGHRARKFEPQAAMQLMADHAVRNVFLPPTALKLMRQADVRHPGVKLRSMLHRRRVARRRAAGLGARDLRHRCP